MIIMVIMSIYNRKSVDNIYKAKISKMNAEKIISDAYAEIKKET